MTTEFPTTWSVRAAMSMGTAKLRRTNKTYREALETILKLAMEHPAFDGEAFDRRDVDGLCKVGGDVCDWTMLAIIADDALNKKGER